MVYKGLVYSEHLSDYGIYRTNQTDFEDRLELTTTMYQWTHRARMSVVPSTCCKATNHNIHFTEHERIQWFLRDYDRTDDWDMHVEYNSTFWLESLKRRLIIYTDLRYRRKCQIPTDLDSASSHGVLSLTKWGLRRSTNTTSRLNAIKIYQHYLFVVLS